MRDAYYWLGQANLWTLTGEGYGDAVWITREDVPRERSATPRIGLVCSGNVKADYNALRAIPIERFAPVFAAAPDAEWHSLQIGPMVAKTGNAALVSKLEELERERDGLLTERAGAVDRAKLKRGLRSLTAKQVEAMLEFALVPLPGAEPDVPYVRRSLAALVKRIELDPETRTSRIQYSVPLTGGAKVASPQERTFAPLTPRCLIWGPSATLRAHARRRGGPAPVGLAGLVAGQ